MVLLTVVGAVLQTAPLLWGAWALRREFLKAKEVVDRVGGPEGFRPPPTTTFLDALYMRELLTAAILAHSWKQTARGLLVIVAGTMTGAVANVWASVL